jgi:hypothetical protein
MSQFSDPGGRPSQWCVRKPRRERRTGRPIGVLLILVSLFWYGAVVDWFVGDWWESGLIGPSVLMLIGVWIVLRPSLRRRESQRR